MYLNSSWPYSVNILVNLSSGNGLLLAHYQAIAWYNADLFSIAPLRTTLSVIIPPATKLGGVYWIQPVCLSVCLSVRLSVCPSVCLSVNFFVSAL